MSDALFAFVVNAAWQSTLIAVLGLALARLLANARQRFELLALTLVAAAAAPALTFAPPVTAVSTIAPVDLAVVENRGGDAITLLYFAGLAIVAIRLLAAVLRARRIALASVPYRGRMRLSHIIDSPVTIGRTVFLPSSIATDRTLLAAALAHEHAHVRRNDYLLHVLLELIALPLYFHPAAIALRRAIAHAREMACDEEAAGRRGRRAYAEALVRLASIAGRRRLTMAVGMAESSIERRVHALLHATTSRAKHRTICLAVLLLGAAACTRFNAVEHPLLCGRWELIREASQLPVAYDRFTQTIEHGPTRIAIRQERTTRGRTRLVSWRAITDGIARPFGRGRGTATWRDGKLQLQFVGPGAHRESATAFIRDGRLICEGVTERSRYHTEFRRIDP
jgi:beta-lactamase regulating signal transducer with metallopeptidase domain